jgi:hypothetical protein
MIDDVRKVQNSLEDTFMDAQEGIESAAVKLYAESPDKAKDFLNRYTTMTAMNAVDSWKHLGEYLIVKYNDGVVKRTNADGSLMRPATGNSAPLTRPGYPKEFQEILVKATGDRYKAKK